MKKRIFVTVAIICSLFLMYNIVWGINCYQYRKYEKKVGYDEQRQSYVIEKDGYLFSVFRPDYLSFTGNLAINKRIIYGDKQEYNYIDMLIWPTLTGKFTVGIMIKHETTSQSETSMQVKGDSVDLEFDEKGALVPECAHLEKDYLEHKDEIEKLYSMAEEMWGIKLPH